MCASPDLAEDQLVPYCRWSSIGRPTSPHPSKCMQEHHVKDWQKWKNYQKNLRENTLWYVADQPFHILLENSLSFFFNNPSSLFLLLHSDFILMAI